MCVCMLILCVYFYLAYKHVFHHLLSFYLSVWADTIIYSKIVATNFYGWSINNCLRAAGKLLLSIIKGIPGEFP